ncbi:MAG: hypothetical protein ABIR96_08135 [Bdellovibrionota bacterium]
MNQFSKILILVSVLASASASFAGGVSDGGGGTTNPNPTDPIRLIRLLGRDATPLLRAWFNDQKANYFLLDEAKRKESPFYKIFNSQQEIDTVIKGAVVELNMSEACHDAKGQPVDGSVHASRPGAICLSPFSMSPKLNDLNVEAETLALLAHEFSHIFDTTEAEAIEIQNRALWTFSKLDPVDALIQLDLLVGRQSYSGVQPLLVELRYLSKGTLDISTNDQESIYRQMLEIRDKLSFQGKLQYLSADKLDVYTPQFTRLDALWWHACKTESFRSEDERGECQAKLDLGFATDSEVTARTFACRTTFVAPAMFPDSYDRVIIERLDSRESGQREVARLLAYMEDVFASLQELKESQIDFVRK